MIYASGLGKKQVQALLRFAKIAVTYRPLWIYVGIAVLLLSVASHPTHAQHALASKSFNLTNVSLTSDDTNNMILDLEELMDPLRQNGMETLRFEDAADDLVGLVGRRAYRAAVELYNKTAHDILTAQTLITLEQENTILFRYAQDHNLNVSQALVENDRGLNGLTIGNIEKAKQGLQRANSLLVGVLQPLSDSAFETATNIVDSMSIDSVFYSQAKKHTEDLEMARLRADFGKVFVLVSEVERVNASYAKYSSLQQSTSSLELEGYATEQIEDQLDFLEDLFAQERNAEFDVVFNETRDLVERIRPLGVRIRNTSTLLQDSAYQDLDLTEPLYFLNLSQHEFALGNFDVAEEHRASAQQILQELEQEFLLSVVVNKSRQRFDYVEFVKDNWLALLISAVMLYYGLKALHVWYRRKLYLLKVVSLRKEEHALMDLMRELQSSYFQKQDIDKETYQSQSSEYEKRLTAIREDIPLTEEKVQEIDQQISDFKNKLLRQHKQQT